MNAVCSICSVCFGELNPLSSVPCGHIYHDKCLKMLSEKSVTCPECQLRFNLRSVRKLCFNFESKSDAKSSEMENEFLKLSAQLKAKDEELEACKKEEVEITREAEKLVSDMKEYTSKLVNEKYEMKQRAKFALKQLLKAREIIRASIKDIETDVKEMDGILKHALRIPNLNK